MDFFTEMWKVMKRFHFPINSQLSIDLSCIICSRLVIDACQGQCGCIYCNSCITGNIEREINHCPSENSICKLEGSEETSFRLNIIKDNHVNRRVSKLIYKCPYETCQYNCKLIEMSDHLRICDHSEIICPYAEIGCTTEIIQNEGLCNHLSDETYLHSKLLNEWIVNTKNEISSLMNLKCKEELQNEVNVLNIKLTEIIVNNFNENQVKQSHIDQLKSEVVNLKNKNSELEKLFKQIKVQIKSQNKEIKQLKEINLEIELLRNVVNQISNESKVSERNCGTESDFIALHRWNVSDFKQRRIKRNPIWSDDFFSVNYKYRMRLLLDPYNSRNNSKLSIRFFIYNGSEIVKSDWPFEGHVKVSIRNMNNVDCCKESSQRLTIKQPADEFNDSNFFYFLYSDLEKLGVLFDGLVVVECLITCVVDELKDECILVQ